MTQAAMTIVDRIARAQPALSRKQHKMAEYVLAHPFRVVTMTIEEFAAAAQVSVATASRFARALDLSGYPQFRAELARGFQATLESADARPAGPPHPAGAAQVVTATLEEDIRNAQHSLQRLDARACEQAVETILAADRVFITAALGLIEALSAAVACRTRNSA